MAQKRCVLERLERLDLDAAVNGQIALQVPYEDCPSKPELATVRYRGTRRHANVLEDIEEGDVEVAVPGNELSEEALDGIHRVEELESIC
jgi:hypothetical protein